MSGRVRISGMRNFRGVYQLFSPQKPNARGKRPFVEAAEAQILQSADCIVYRVRILAVRNIVESAAQCPIKSHRMKALLEVRIECEVSGKSIGARRQHQLLLAIDDGKGESSTGFN